MQMRAICILPAEAVKGSGGGEGKGNGHTQGEADQATEASRPEFSSLHWRSKIARMIKNCLHQLYIACIPLQNGGGTRASVSLPQDAPHPCDHTEPSGGKQVTFQWNTILRRWLVCLCRNLEFWGIELRKGEAGQLQTANKELKIVPAKHTHRAQDKAF